MKIKITLIVLFIVAAGLFIASSGGRNDARAGAPGDASCSGCHSGGTTNGSTTITGIPARFIYGQSYNLAVVVCDPDAAGAGFQVVAANCIGNTAVGTFTAGAGSRVTSPVGRLTHSGTLAMSGTGATRCATFNFTWTAPAKAGAPANVCFYANGNAVDGTGGTGGDAVYAFATTATPLPVELSDFKVAKVNNDVVLSWATKTETDNDFFEIERSIDGVNFNPIKKVNGAGTTILPQNYEAKDENAPVSKIYYRLRQVDFNATYAYSSIVTFDNSKGSVNLSIFPNPSRRLININLFAFESADEVSIQIFDMSGKVIFSENTTGNRIHFVDGVDFAAGIYSVEVQCKQTGYWGRQKLLIQK